MTVYMYGSVGGMWYVSVWGRKRKHGNPHWKRDRHCGTGLGEGVLFQREYTCDLRMKEKFLSKT